jgi:uncharacterized membrane protein YhaH (DUF805 family)
MSIDFPALFLRHHGRIDRRSFWIGMAILIVAGAFASVIPFVGQFVGLIILWPVFCLLAQRLHDTGRSGRMAVLALVPAAVGAVIGLVAGLIVMTPMAGLALLPLLALVGVLTGLLGLVSLAFIIWAGVLPGDADANAWGRPPAASMDLRRSF